MASGIAFAVQIWCIDRGGPVFVAVYQPVQTLVVAIMASFALGEEFYLGGYVPATSPARSILLPNRWMSTCMLSFWIQMFVCLTAICSGPQDTYILPKYV